MPPPFPLIPGYQKVGMVESVGRDVPPGLRKGQWVFVTVTRSPETHLGIAGHVSIGPADAAEVLPLPEGVDPVHYAGLVLTQVGYNAGTRMSADAGGAALVVGDGLVGHWAAQTFQERGFRVALVGRHDRRLALWQRCAQDIILNTTLTPEWIERAAEWAGGDGFAVVIDTVGNDTNLETNERLASRLRRGGHFVVTGHNGDRRTDLKPFICREATLHCPAGWTRERLEDTRDWVASDRLRTAHLVTHRLPAHQAAKAWRLIREERDATLGVVLDWE
jgi:2-desacetyl-2-hydroxyethyl bacteriochlorophyllide A dehydrogenase